MEAIKIKISHLKSNIGRIEGLPANPRLIKDEKFNKLKKSIQEHPEMLELRELIVYPFEQNFVVIAGNMRLSAMKELGYKEAICKVLDENTDAERLRAYTIKDNVGYGEHDWDMLANEWDSEELTDWGLDVWNPVQEPDYSILDGEDLSGQLQDMAGGVKKAIQIEFEPEHYEEAQELIKFWRGRELYIGGFLIEKLKDEKLK